MPQTGGMSDDITPAQLADDAVLLDVREQNEWDAGHAPTAVHIPLGDLPTRLDDLPSDDSTLAVVCRSGGRSSQAVAWLTQQGFDVVNVDGGMKSWASAGKPMTASCGEPRVL